LPRFPVTLLLHHGQFLPQASLWHYAGHKWEYPHLAMPRLYFRTVPGDLAVQDLRVLPLPKLPQEEVLEDSAVGPEMGWDEHSQDRE
jgi:hypothetical protein